MPTPPGRIKAVWFDVGEVLIDETREYGTWADWIGVPRHTFSAVFGAVIARGEDYRQVFQHFCPGFDLAVERQKRVEAGLGEYFNAHDVYPDVRPCLEKLKADGYFVGIAGNQTERAGHLLRELYLPCDVLATSADWGAEKPSPAFFAKLIAATGNKPHEICYVGDRVENDIEPAMIAQVAAVQVHRGPWANIRSIDRPADPKWPIISTLNNLSELIATI